MPLGDSSGVPSSSLPRTEQLKKPQTPLSLRMSGHLLLGLSRIFARKVQYLYHDSSEAFANMKSVRAPWRRGGVAAHFN